MQQLGICIQDLTRWPSVVREQHADALIVPALANSEYIKYSALKDADSWDLGHMERPLLGLCLSWTSP